MKTMSNDPSGFRPQEETSSMPHGTFLIWRTLRLLVPLIFIICLIFGFLSFYLYAKESSEHMHQDHEKVLNLAALALPNAIWNFDQAVIQQYLETLSDQPSIHAVRYYDHHDDLVESITKEGTAISPMTHERQLVYSSSLVTQKVGRLEIESTDQPLVEKLYQVAALLSGIALFIVAGVVVLISWQLKHYALTPLNRAIKSMRQLEGPTEHFEAIPLVRTHEVNNVIDNLNMLGRQLFVMMEALRNNEERYQHFYRDTPALLLVVDMNGIIQDASQELINIISIPRATLSGMRFDELFDSRETDQLSRVQSALQTGTACDDLVLVLKCQYQENRDVQVVIPAAKETQESAMLLLNDITELMQTQKRLMEHELVDGLTRLPNRIALNRHLTSLMSQEVAFSLLFVNIDRFHSINHHLGPSDGDRLLVEVGERLQQCEPDWLGRNGGDEFVMLCDIKQLSSLVKRIEQAFAEPLLKAGEPIYLFFSMAGLDAHAGLQTPNQLLRQLEHTMVEIKHAGGNQYRMCSRESAQQESEALFLNERMIREALTMQWFSLYLQPIYDAASPDLDAPELLGAEALIRLEHPELGLISPDDFIPAAEKTGQIIEIGNWVLKEAAVILCEWQKQGFSTRYLSVNASVIQFRNHGLLHQLESLIERYPINPTQLVIEVTENLMLDSEESLRYQLDAIRKLGVNLSLDDFGTGFSCLSYLHELPFGTLKIDRSFVNNVGTSPRDKQLARVIVDMASSLDMQVVVEGIEQRDQAEIFQAMGVRAFQGYHFARPMPLETFEARFGATDSTP